MAASGNVIQIVATGKAQSMPVIRDWMMVEPSIKGIIVPTREWGSVTAQEIVRLMRIYFPRTFQDLVSYDFLFLAQVDMSFISPRQAQWMHDAMGDYGLGAVNTRSVMSMNLWLSEPWATSVMSQAFPNDAMAVVRSPYYLMSSARVPSGPILVNDDEDLAPVMKPFKRQIERTFPSYAGLLTIPREGSRIHSWLRTGLSELAYPLPGYVPHVMEWDYGKATTFTLMDMVYDSFWSTNLNPFALDIVANMIWRACRRELPTDAMKVHLLRDRLAQYSSQKSVVVSVFDFAEKFGANAFPLYDRLAGLEIDKSSADGLYLDGEFDQAYSLVEEIIGGLNDLAEQALKLKDQAMIWIYVMEWIVVVATSMLCGVSIWILMVKRQLYRRTEVTRVVDRPPGRRIY